MTQSPRFAIAVRALVVLAVLAGYCLRMYRLGSQSLWYDETVSAYLAALPLADMVQHTARDIHPPGYYAVLALWQRLVQPYPGHGLEFLYALPSVCFGLLVVALLWPLARRIVTVHVAVLAVWLGAINPFLIWYSQEVRMYALGACLALIALWAAVRYLEAVRYDYSAAHWRQVAVWLSLYTLSAAAGLYVLYYYLFWLAGLNVAVLWALSHRAPRAASSAGSRVWLWLAAQAALLLIWLPWLPVFVHQAVEPPVPPWRQPWSGALPFLRDLSEAVAALLVGQSTPAWTIWFWAVLAVVVGFAFDRYTKSILPDDGYPSPTSGRVLLATLAMAGAMIFLVSVFLTPLYHVRYVATYTPGFSIVTAGGVAYLWRTRRWQAAMIVVLLVVGAGVSLARFWYDPLYRADDHRQAVADLAQRWRPGDAVLVNAGWAYPALYTYWPRGPEDGITSLPYTLATPVRLTDYTKSRSVPSNTDRVPVLITGSVDGADTLGWGLPDSDFFPVAAGATRSALAEVAQNVRRIWHYRLYDTVSDPNAVIRDWLSAELTQLDVQPYPGRDYLRVELYGTAPITASMALSSLAGFSNAVALVDRAAPTTHTAGTTLYAELTWLPRPALTDIPVPLAVSLRLYDSTGALAAQADERPLPSTTSWQVGKLYRQPLALPVPTSLPAGSYTLEAVLYRTDDLSPLTATAADGTTAERVPLAAVEVMPAALPSKR